MTEERIAQLEQLIEIGRHLNSTLRLPPLLHRIAATAQELTETEACSILLVDRKSGQLYFEAASGAQGYRMHSIVVPMENSIAGWVVQNGKPLVITDARNDPRFYRQADELSKFTTHSVLAVPLMTREKVIGVLEAVNKKGEDEFTKDDIDLLSVLADQAAVAVQNALLFQQSDLISEFVHEIRTPLASIISYADLIQRPGTTPDQRHQFADTIRQEAGRLNQMADNYLDLAQLESGRASLAQDPVDMNTVTYMAVNVLKPKADVERIQISVEVPDNLPPVVGDAQRLHQVMTNLLDNAIKYGTPGDEITVTADSREGLLTVSVQDTGPGIPKEYLPHIFERFYRVPGAETQESGAGLGLTITRQIIEAHNGEIDVSSEEGKGTTFTFTLPVKQTQ